MTYGIIYRAYNKISKKSYVGKSIQPLKHRIQQHYYSAKKANHKFANALKFYSPEVWEWETLAEIEIDKLDEYELFFINDLDTFNRGYNTLLETYDLVKSRKPNYDSNKVYNLYHKQYGDISATRDELRKLNSTLVTRLSELESGKYKSYLGFVLAENKNNYEKLQINRNKKAVDVLTLTHPKFGTYTLTRKEFKEQFGLSSRNLSLLACKQGISSKKWRLLDASETKN